VRPYKLLYLAGFPQIRRRGDFVFRAFEEIAKYEDIHLTVRWMDRLLERDLSLFHRAIQSHVGKVHCSNNRSREGILQDYQDHDLMLWPTCREGLGLIGLESVYHGTPVVSFNVPPLHEFLINGINSVLSNHSVGSSFEGIPEIHQPSYESFRESLLVAIQNIDRLTETTSLPCYSRINTFNKQWDQFLGRL
jgi:glycosyltransferase involved in cell wall biosynthesis